MTIRTLLVTACVLTAAASLSAAPPQQATAAPRPAPRVQTPAPQPGQPATAPAQAIAPPPRRTGQPVNVKIDVTLGDQRDGAPALKKTVSVVTADGMIGYIRTQAAYTSAGEVWLNIDTEPEILSDGKIRARVNVQYDLPEKTQPTEASAYGRLVKTQIRENLALILESGKPITVAQSADPVGDRQVTIEVKATVLR